MISLFHIEYYCFYVKFLKFLSKYRFFATIQTNLQEIRDRFSYLTIAEFFEILCTT